MNDRDSEALLGLFLEKGYQQAQSEKEAEVILINTCSVREHAEDRAISYAGTFKKTGIGVRVKGKGKSKESSSPSPQPLNPIPQTLAPIIGIIGCMAKNRGEELFKKMPHISLVCGPASFAKIPAYVEKIKKTGERIIDLEDGLRDEELYRAAFRMESDHAQVVISTGCSNYCSYCVVPYVRGSLRLRKPEDILDEVRRNVSLGIKKITLLGQNVNDYEFKFQAPNSKSQINSPPKADPPNRFKVAGNDQNSKFQTINFVELLKKVDKIEGIEEISFITSQPRNTTKELFEVMAQSPRIKKHLHLPFQSGSNRILKLMKRGYTREKYLQLCLDYKKIVNGTLSTDVIVGFPTETDEDFEQTKDILEQVRFHYAFIFKYSPRMRAESARLNNDVPEVLKAERHARLLSLQKKISAH